MKVVEIVRRTDVGKLRKVTTDLTAVLGFGEEERPAIVLAVSELAANTVEYGGGGHVVFFVNAGRLIVCTVDRKQDRRGLRDLREGAAVVRTNVMVVIKQLPGTPEAAGGRSEPTATTLAASWFGGRALWQLGWWTPTRGRALHRGQLVVDCYRDGDELVLLAAAELAPTLPDKLDDHGRGYWLAATLMDWAGIGVLAIKPGN